MRRSTSSKARRPASRSRSRRGSARRGSPTRLRLDGPAITHEDPRLKIPADASRILLKTRNSALWDQPGFQTLFIGIDAAAAAALVARGPGSVGVDYLSVAPFGDPIGTHRALLSAGVAVLEGMDLGEVEPGPVDFCLPIRLLGSDGVPARASAFGRA